MESFDSESNRPLDLTSSKWKVGTSSNYEDDGQPIDYSMKATNSGKSYTEAFSVDEMFSVELRLSVPRRENS